MDNAIKIEYNLDESDYLTHQLYMASKSERIKKKRRKSRLLIPILYVVIAVISIIQQNIILSSVFILVAVIWFLFYPLYERNHYEKHYKSFIAENYKSITNRNVSLEMNDDFVLGKYEGGEIKIATSEIRDITEIQNLILIKLSGPATVIIPTKKIFNTEQVIVALKNLATKLSVTYTLDTDWKWR